MTNLGYRAIYYSSYADTTGTLLHETSVDGDKVTVGKIEQSLSDIGTFEFEITYEHVLYNKINPLTGLVKVINKYDNEVEFYGRVLKPTSSMDNSGYFSKSFTCESLLGYLQDSTQTYQKLSNISVADYFKKMIDTHNNQVEAHKRFKLGRVTVSGKSDSPNRYVGYDTTFDTIKTYLIDKLGGYIQMRIEEDGIYLDYLAEVGKNVNSPIQLGTNIETSSKEIDLSELITRLVPLGADLDEETKDEETGQYAVRRRVTINSVNGGKTYIEDTDLVKQFGIIQRPMDWTEINTPSILLSRGRQYMQSQKIAVSSWSVSVLELYLLDNSYKKFKIGNTHPIDNPPISGVEKLQIIKKVIDITQPESVDLTVGSDSMTLSRYQLQQREATKSMEKVISEQNAIARANEEKAAKEQQLNLLKSELSNLQMMRDDLVEEINYFNEQISYLDSEEDSGLIASLNAQKNASEVKKKNYDSRIAELENQIKNV